MAETEAPVPLPVTPAAPESRGPAGAFTTGPTLRHVLVMTGTGSIGLISIFIVDFLNLFYISLLGQQELAAAVGYAGTVLFFLTSVGIGITIGVTALVSRALGARDRERARRLAASGLIFAGVSMLAASALAMVLADGIVGVLGATGTTRDLAARFLIMTLPSNVLLGLGMCFAGVLRGVGDARRAMFVTLSGGIAAAIADPILIFGLDLALDGAAIAMNIARAMVCFVGWYGAVRVHKLVARPTLATVSADVAAIGAIAGPAVLTNIATPVANGYVTAELARHGDAAVAAWAIIGRLIPVAYGAVFALSGSVGPILGQNQGAKLFGRVRSTLTNSLVLMTVYILTVWTLLIFAQGSIVRMFQVEGEAAHILVFFLWISVLWVFMGGLFVANAAFNTLGAPLYATAFNWGRATLGTIPFAYIGGRYFGPEGVLLAQSLGGVVFGIGAVIMSYVLITRLERSGP
jgi:putative MATE family efflux protein